MRSLAEIRSASSRSIRQRPGEAALLAAFALWSLVPLAYLLGPGAEGVFNGSDGLQVDDHLQYLAFVRDAGEHGLQANRFDVVSDPHLFLHPMFALSGLLWSMGASVQAAFLIWKPVAVVALMAGFVLYVRRMLADSPGGSFAALALALFYFAPAAALAEWLGASEDLRFGTLVVSLEPYVASYSWSGFPGGIGVACMPLFLLAVERVLVPGRRAAGRSAGWYAAWAGLAGLLASWLHPWQGMILLTILAGLVAWDRFDRRNLALAVPVVLTAAPLAYFSVLSHTDSSWAYASRANDYHHFGTWFVLGLIPALAALPGFPGRDLDVQERILRLWPAAAVLVYFVLQQSWFYHALAGLSLPLSILAVRAWKRFELPRAAAIAAFVVLTLPGMVFVMLELRKTREDHFFTSDERQALAYLDKAKPTGPVLAPQTPLGVAVPAFTGRNTYVGHYYWTPDYDRRVQRAALLFSGAMTRAQAGVLLHESRAAFLASDCRNRTDLAALLGPWLRDVRRFGCATVYELRRPSR